MKTFFDLRERKDPEQILEALDSPQEFFMTDDTKIPTNIHGLYEYDGSTYGMALIETDLEKIYEFRFYRINGKKPFRWKFTKSSHIRPALSTILKFMELCMPFIKNRCDGITIPIAGKLASQKFNKLAEMTVRQSYIKSFRYVPVISAPPDPNKKYQSYNYLFLVRRPKTPQSVFSSKTFSDFKWDETTNAKKADYSYKKDNGVPEQVLDQAKPKKRLKPTVSTTPSKKYQFKNYEIKYTPIDKDDEIGTYEDPDESKVIKLSKAQAIMPTHQYKDVTPNDKKTVEKKPVKPEEPKKPDLYISPKELSNLLMVFMRSVRKKLEQQGGFDEKLFNWANFKYVFNKHVGSDVSDPVVKEMILHAFKQYGILDKNGEFYDTDASKEIVKKLLKDANPYGIPSIQGETGKKYTEFADYLTQLKKYKTDIEEYESVMSVGSSGSATMKTSKGTIVDVKAPKSTIVDETIDWSKLVSTIDGQGEFYFTESVPYGMEKDEGGSEKDFYIRNDLGYGDLYDKGLSAGQASKLKSYTGSHFVDYNSPLRKYFGEAVKTGSLSKYKATLAQDEMGKGKKIYQLRKAFDGIEPLPESVWVYRNGKLPTLMKESDIYPPNDFVDPAFLSTSLRSTMTLGLEDLRLRIFVPKGSRVIPALGNNSSHSSEQEILLPPASVLRIIRYDKTELKYGKEIHVITCIFKGHIFDSLYEEYESLTSEEYVMEQKKDKEEKNKRLNKYKPEDKFGSTYDPKFSKKVSKSIKDGKYKVKK